MPSIAYDDHLELLLSDAVELIAAHTKLKTGKRGRQHGLAAINRAVVLACVSAWEAYIEELVRQSLTAMRPPLPPLGTWVPLSATIRAQLGRFNTPNTQNVRLLISDAVGLPNVNDSWVWRNCTAEQAARRLEGVLNLRHEITHGVNPRPVVNNEYASILPDFIRRLGRVTAAAVRNHLGATLGVADPWPA